MTKTWLLPDVIDPPETVCVTIEVPKDDAHIRAFFGALDELERPHNWDWDGLKSGLATASVWRRQIALAAQAVRTGANCMLDCADVEDCLETSTIINVIEGDIIINETDIINNTDEITINETNITNIISGGNDTNVYPVLPTEAEPDELCGASHEVARQIIALVEQTVIDAGMITVAAFLLNWLGIGGWFGTQLALFWDYIFANEIALSGVDFDVYQDEMSEALYCGGLDITTAISLLDTGIPTLRRDALIKGMEAATEAQIALWAFVGSLDDTEDCTAYVCGEWCKTFDFKAAQHGLTILDGGTWESGLGWRMTFTNPDYWLLAEMQFPLQEITSVEIKVDWGQNRVNSGITLYGRNDDDSSDILDNDDVDTGFTTYTLSWSGSEEYKAIPVWLRQGSGNAAWLTEMTIHGTGSNPFGADNC